MHNMYNIVQSVNELLHDSRAAVIATIMPQ